MLTAVLFGSFAPTIAQAQSTDPADYIRAFRTGEWYDQGPFSWYKKVYDTSNPQEIFGERYTAAQVQWIFYSIPAFFIHSIISPTVFLCLMDLNPIGGTTISDDCRGIITDIIAHNNEIDLAKQPMTPSRFLTMYFEFNHESGLRYFVNKIQNFHLIPEASAQGYGFLAFQDSAVQKLWAASRDISYSMFIFIAIVMAFMIMFRMEMAPRVTISAISAIPKLAIALVLVTFSYAIATFAIDVMYVAIGLVIGLFSTSNLVSLDFENAFTYLRSGPFKMGILGIIGQYLSFFYVSYFAAIFSQVFGSFGSLDITGEVVGLVMGLPSFFLVFLLPFILAIAGLWIAFRAFIFMFKNYITIIFSIIFAPFIILLGTIGQGPGFNGWLKNLVAALAVYPALSVIVLLMFLFVGQPLGKLTEVVNLAPNEVLGIEAFPFNYEQTLLTGSTWNAPLTVGEDYTSFLFLGVSFMLFMMIPNVGNFVQGFMSGKGFSMGKGDIPATGIGLGLLAANAGVGQKVLAPYEQAAKTNNMTQWEVARAGGKRETAEWLMGKGAQGIIGAGQKIFKR